jgi:hypothetical protein
MKKVTITEEQASDLIRDYYKKHEAFSNDPRNLSSKRRGPEDIDTAGPFFRARDKSDTAQVDPEAGPVSRALMMWQGLHRAASLNTYPEYSEDSNSCSLRMELLEHAEVRMCRAAGCGHMTTLDEVLPKYFPNLGKMHRDLPEANNP